MDLGQNYTQFVDDVESGEFDNFLSKRKRAKMKATRNRIKELRKGGMRLKDAIIQAQKEAIDRRKGMRPAIGRPLVGPAIGRRVAVSQRRDSKPINLSKRPLLLDKKLTTTEVDENGIDENVVVDELSATPTSATATMDDLDVSVDGVNTDTTDKKEDFLTKYKTLLMVGGALVVGYFVFKKFGAKGK